MDIIFNIKSVGVLIKLTQKKPDMLMLISCSHCDEEIKQNDKLLELIMFNTPTQT